jgi:hypothetical protein
MSEQIAGVIESIYTKDITIKNGKRAGQTSKVYHALINGHDVNLGFQTSLAEGEQVVLDVEHKYGSYQLVQPGKQNVSSSPTVGSAPSNAPTKRPGAANKPAFPIATNTKDISIIRQSSLNRAVEVVETMLDAGIIVIRTEEEYLNKVFEVAYQFTDFGSGQREVKQAAVMAAYEEE